MTTANDRGREADTGRATRRWRVLAAALCAALLAALMPVGLADAAAQDRGGLFPWQIDDDAPAGAAPIGAGFEVSMGDLVFILDQIKIAEHHMGPTFDPNDPCGNLIGTGPNQIPEGPNAEQLQFGLRTLNGICNNLVPGQEKFGSTGEPFIHLTSTTFPDAQVIDCDGPFGPAVAGPSTYDFPNTNTCVGDTEPRVISNLIADQTNTNPAATAAAGNPADPGAGVSYNIENVAPDEGLSAPFNSTLTFFGQFFDHGLDLTTKNGQTVFIPLQLDDPLFAQAGQTPFMVLSRAQLDGVVPVNQTSPFVDQNQTYTSHPSQQVFHREYAPATVDPDGAGPKEIGDPVDTGRLYVGIFSGEEGLATWADIKNNAASLGFALSDEDVLEVPLMAADFYGNYIPGPNGYPQMVFPGLDGLPGTLDDVLVEGDPLAPVSSAGAVGTGHGWLVDIAHSATPGGGLVPDADSALGLDATPNAYDDEMLDAHFMCGDGRCNENIALSAVHHVFHSEHNRVVEQIKDTLTNEASASFLAEWQLADGSWNGARLFQAAKFTTEMEYQHLAFEEFARTIQPFVNEFIGYDTTIDARISAEFAHAAYRFGHSMLNEEVVRFDTATGQEHSLGLIQAFLNPPEFFAGLNGGTKTPDEAAGGLLAGSTTQVGQHIDEFLVEALRNNLLGLPLDLATLNIARGRDTGLGSLNSVRADIFAATNSNPIFEPYESWFDFMLGLETQESIVNFVAAYGIHPTIVVGDTVANRRAAAELLVQDQAFMMADGSTTGVDEIDLWMGGLAEKKEIFGGMLGSTLNYIFELQMENLQNGDRFYYLHRLQGLPLLAALEGNSFSELIERNTTAEQLPANVFTRPSFTFDIEVISPTACAGLFDDPSTDYDDSTLLNMFPAPDCTIRYTDAEHALFSGRVTGDDFIHSGDGDDTVRGHGGNDRLEGGGGNDGIVGGEGDDIITDSFGDDVLKGGPGDDAIHGGPGLDLLMGNAGGDFVVLGSDPGEIFGGAGNDFLLGGDSFDVLFGDDGDDWIEGGDQADLVQGDGGNIFENDPTGTDGDDVIDAGGGNDDNLGEGGNDIIIFSEGTDAFEGMLGFDWLTHRGDPQAADSDLERFEAIPIPVEPLASRFEYVEGLSGWMHDDVLRGDGVLPEILQAPGSHALDAAGIAKITNLDLLLPFGTTFFEGNIILGGGGSDLIEGRGLNDIIDGDAWLNVQLEAGGNRYDSLGDLQADVFAGLIDPGTITIVREILWEAPGSDIDTAEFDGLYADYDITENPDGSLTVVHARGTGALGAGNCPDITSACDDGTDILFNIERLVFADLVIAAPCSDCLLRVTTNPAVPSQIILDGAPVDRWALDWVKVAPGPHTVCFSDVEGWQTPACETVNVSPGATTFVQGDFVQLGHLRVITDPPVPSTITIDGVPSNDWAFWSDVATGSREVCFGDVAGFDTPACQTVNVTAGALTTVTGTFTPNVAATGPVDPFGLLRVTTESSETGGGVPGEIIVDGVGLDRWALNWMKLTPGTYEVCFGDLQNFSAPGCEEVTVHDGQVTSVVGVYEDRGILRVETVTPRPSTITANSVPLNDWGVWTDLPVGQYTICFGEADGFTPACQVVDLVAGQTEFVQGVWP